MTRKLLVLIVLGTLSLPTWCLAQRGKVKDFEGEFPNPEIFLGPLKNVGRFTGKSVFLVTDPAECLDGNGNPIPRCFTLPPQSEEACFEWDEVDIETMVIPAKTLRDVIVVNLQHVLNANLQNLTSEDGQGLIRSTIALALESPALADPSLINPATGLPFDGRWDVALPGTRRLSVRLVSGQVHGDAINFTRRTYLSRSLLKANLGLSDEVVDGIFDGPITLRMSMEGRACFASDTGILAFPAIEGH